MLACLLFFLSIFLSVFPTKKRQEIMVEIEQKCLSHRECRRTKCRRQRRSEHVGADLARRQRGFDTLSGGGGMGVGGDG